MTETPPSELPIVDLGDAALWQDPAAALANAREAAPLARTARGERVVLRYSETEQLLADPRMRTVGGRLLDGIGIHDGPSIGALRDDSTLCGWTFSSPRRPLTKRS